jgi:SAM-dependent methyltransferase
MRPIVAPGTRLRKVIDRMSQPLPESIRNLMLRLDYRREERRTARIIEGLETEPGLVDGIPVPPPLLRVRVTGGIAEPGKWLATGTSDAELIGAMLDRNGSPLEEMGALLDFGCGCGRVARHWADLRGPAIHGADVSRRAVRWCQRNLRFMQTVRCEPQPPLPYGEGTFDFVYALSVLTHLSEVSTQRWFAELVRILKPGGHLLFTVHGERFLHQLDESDSKRFHQGEFVAARRPAAQSGSNYFAGFHPPEYVKAQLLSTVDLELVEAIYDGPEGIYETPLTLQDNYLARKRVRSAT